MDDNNDCIAAAEAGKKLREHLLKMVDIKDSNVYCAKCGVFLGMTCDPFSPDRCKACFPLKEN